MTRTGVKDNRIIFYANAELKDKLDKEANENMIKRSSLIYNKLEKFYDEIIDNKYESLDDACPLLGYLEEDEAPKKKGKGFYCLQRAPKEDLLGSGTIEAQKKYCDACQFREVNSWCKVLRNGANCECLRWSTMTVKGKLTEKDYR